MSLETLSRDILSLADSEIEKFEKEKESDLDSFKHELNLELETYKKKFQTLYEKEYLSAKQSILGSAQKESKSLVLETKSELIDEVYSKTLDELRNLSGKVREDFLKLLISRAKLEFDFGKVICMESDSKFLKSTLNGVEVKSDSKVSGLIFESKDSKQILDMTFKSILDDFFSDNEEKVQKRLFK